MARKYDFVVVGGGIADQLCAESCSVRQSGTSLQNYPRRKQHLLRAGWGGYCDV